MIYLTGDFHGDKKRFRSRNVRRLKRGDTLIICGDFGFIWDGSEQERKLLERIGKLKYNVLFVEGAHDNLKLLNEYPVEEWNGGLTHTISGKLRHLIRGERFVLEDLSILAIGGGHIIDDIQPQGGYTSNAMPTIEDISLVRTRLKEHDGLTDIIVSHQAPTNIDACITHKQCDVSFLTAMLDTVQKDACFKVWCFGNYHQNKQVPPFYHALYDEVYCAGGKRSRLIG